MNNLFCSYFFYILDFQRENASFKRYLSITKHQKSHLNYGMSFENDPTNIKHLVF